MTGESGRLQADRGTYEPSVHNAVVVISRKRSAYPPSSELLVA
jgi:hypothetical protein